MHERLFAGVFNHAGKIRDYNITKKEWVLNGDTVIYLAFDINNDIFAKKFWYFRNVLVVTIGIMYYRNYKINKKRKLRSK